MCLKRKIFVSLILVVLLFGCVAPPRTSTVPPAEKTTLPTRQQAVTETLSTPVDTASVPKLSVVERDILEMPIASPWDAPEREYSGMDWYGDLLVLLPQYPARLPAGGDFDGKLCGLKKSELQAVIDGASSQPLVCQEMLLEDGGLSKSIRGFEGFESIAFVDNAVYLTIEARQTTKMVGYLVKGEVDPSSLIITIDSASAIEIEPQTKFMNASDEAMLIANDQVITFFEDNSYTINTAPAAHSYDFTPNEIGIYWMPDIPFRLTDASEIDADGIFYVINYFFPGDDHLFTGIDPWTESGEHDPEVAVERLIPLQFLEGRVVPADLPVISLVLSDEARNWEGLARFDNMGFLLVTDKFPDSILAFVRN